MGAESTPFMGELARQIREAHSLLLTTHAGPDGDGIGSLVALGRALEERGRSVTRLIPDPLPERYRFLDPEGSIHCLEQGDGRSLDGQWDLAVILDTHRWEMLGPIGDWLRRNGTKSVFLDHHPQLTPDLPGVFADPDVAATGELVYHLLHSELGWGISPEVAEPLYVAISFDTNSFKYIRSNPSSLLIAADLITRGVDTNRVYRHLFAANSLGKARLLGWVLSSVQFECDGRLAYVRIPHRLLAELDLERDEMRDSITHILEIQGVEVAATLKEMDPGQIQISLRSKGTCAVNGVAGLLGGGGHALAAGCDFTGSLDQAWEALRDPLVRALRQC